MPIRLTSKNPLRYEDPGVCARAKAIVTNGVVTSILVTEGGKEYKNAPIVTVFDAGGGIGAKVTASISNGVIASIVLNDGGKNYTNDTHVVIAAPKPPFKDVPVRSLLDMETGKKVIVVLHDDSLTVVHIPRELWDKIAWREALKLDISLDVPPPKKLTATEKTRIESITKAETRAIG